MHGPRHARDTSEIKSLRPTSVGRMDSGVKQACHPDIRSPIAA